MKRISLIMLLALFVSACSEKDNFSEPGESLNGVVLDQETGDSLQSQQPNGLRVRLYDLQYSSPQPIDFWGKQDGSFQNTRLFPGKYDMIVDNGGFYDIDTLSIELPTEEEFQIEVLPFLRISAEVEKLDGGTIVVKSQLEETKSEGNIVERAVFVNSTPYVDFNNFINDNPIINTESVAKEELTNQVLSDTISNLESGKTYYIRAGAVKDEAKGNYNYSKIIKVAL